MAVRLAIRSISSMPVGLEFKSNSYVCIFLLWAFTLLCSAKLILKDVIIKGPAKSRSLNAKVLKYYGNAATRPTVIEGFQKAVADALGVEEEVASLPAFTLRKMHVHIKECILKCFLVRNLPNLRCVAQI